VSKGEKQTDSKEQRISKTKEGKGGKKDLGKNAGFRAENREREQKGKLEIQGKKEQPKKTGEGVKVEKKPNRINKRANPERQRLKKTPCKLGKIKEKKKSATPEGHAQGGGQGGGGGLANPCCQNKE